MWHLFNNKCKMIKVSSNVQLSVTLLCASIKKKKASRILDDVYEETISTSKLEPE